MLVSDIAVNCLNEKGRKTFVATNFITSAIQPFIMEYSLAVEPLLYMEHFKADNFHIESCEIGFVEVERQK